MGKRERKTSKGRGEEEENFVGTLTVSTAPELLASEQKNQESRTRDKSDFYFIYLLGKFV